MEKQEPIMRIYGTLRHFVGENKVYKYGDLLFVSTKNNDNYDLVIEADGETPFIQLYNQQGEQGDLRDYSVVMVRKSK